MELKPGQLVEIENSQRKFGSDRYYLFMYTTEKTPLMFTEKEIAAAETRALNNIEDMQEYPLSDKAFKRMLVILFLVALAIVCALIYFNFVSAHA